MKLHAFCAIALLCSTPVLAQSAATSSATQYQFYIQALTAQRNQANDQVATLAGELNSLQIEKTDLQKQLDALKAKDAAHNKDDKKDAPPPPPPAPPTK